MCNKQGWETKLIFVVLLGIILLSACGSQATQVVSTPSPIRTLVLPTQTPKIPTVKPSTTERPTSTPLPTSTSFPSYPIKQVLAKYAVSGNLGFFDSYVTSDGVKWILYSDGWLIIQRSHDIKEKKLSKIEICSLFNNLSRLGFYEIETNYKNDQTDPLYNFGDKYFEVNDDLYYYIFLNGKSQKNLGTIDSYRNFLIPQMKRVINYIDSYSPGHLSPYRPDRLLVMVDNYEDYGLQPIEYRPLPNDLSTDITNEAVYFEGSKAADMYNQLHSSSNSNLVFTRDNKQYYIDYRVVYPHQVLGDPYQETELAKYPYKAFPNPYKCGN